MKFIRKIAVLSSDKEDGVISSYESYVDEEEFKEFAKSISNRPILYAIIASPYLKIKSSSIELNMAKIDYLNYYLNNSEGALTFAYAKQTYTYDFDSDLSYEEKCSLIRAYLDCCYFVKIDQAPLNFIEESVSLLSSFPESNAALCYYRHLIEDSKTARKLFSSLGFDSVPNVRNDLSFVKKKVK